MRRIAGAFAFAMVGLLLTGALAPESWRTAIADGGPSCPFRAITGIPCATCGMTHATLALGAGDFDAAYAAHPFAPFVLVFAFAIVVAIALGYGPALWRKPRRYVLLAALVTVWVARLVV